MIFIVNKNSAINAAEILYLQTTDAAQYNKNRRDACKSGAIWCVSQMQGSTINAIVPWRFTPLYYFDIS